MSEAPPPLESRFAKAWPAASRHPPLVLAVSGGADSIALARLAVANHPAGDLCVAHFNHRLRGAESDQDQRFVADFCRQFGLEFHTAGGEDADVGGENALRAARYAFLESTARRLGARYLATAHTQDDQLETILHRLMRGTGLTGLEGIAVTRSLNQLTTVVRPLLGFRGDELRAYLADIGQPWREDPSNKSLRYTRNRIRHQLLPLLRDIQPNVEEALLRAAKAAAQANDALLPLADQLVAQFAVPLANGWQVACDELADQPAYLVQLMMRRLWETRNWPQQAMDRPRWIRLAESAQQNAPGSYLMPGAILVQRSGDTLSLTEDDSH